MMNKNGDIFLDPEGAWDNAMKRLIDVGNKQPKISHSDIAKALGAQITFPVVRKVFPNLIANQIVSVQPMAMPVGNLFYQNYVYGGIGNKYLGTKLRPSRIYKAIITGGFVMTPLMDKKFNVIGRVNPFDLCMYVSTEVLVGEHRSLKAYKIMVGDQAGYVDPDRIRFKRVTNRMIRREQIRAEKEDERRRINEMGIVSSNGQHSA